MSEPLPPDDSMSGDIIGELDAALGARVLLGKVPKSESSLGVVKDAIRGRRVHAGSKQRRRPRAGSVREWLETKVPDWRTQKPYILSRQLKEVPEFANRDEENLRRQIRAAKKGGG